MKREDALLEAASRLGRDGSPPVEEERRLFEAWMRGHCWAVCGEWNGTQYVSADESFAYCNPNTMCTRMLWAAWRDRAALTVADAALIRAEAMEEVGADTRRMDHLESISSPSFSDGSWYIMQGLHGDTLRSAIDDNIRAAGAEHD